MYCSPIPTVLFCFVMIDKAVYHAASTVSTASGVTRVGKCKCKCKYRFIERDYVTPLMRCWCHPGRQLRVSPLFFFWKKTGDIFLVITVSQFSGCHPCLFSSEKN